jgi:hypothetical protein
MHWVLCISLRLAAIWEHWFKLWPELEARWDQRDPLLSLWLAAIWEQWFKLQPELEARWDQRDSPTLTVVGRHLGTVIQTSARIGSRWDQRDSPTLTVVGRHLGTVIQTSARIGSPGPGRFPYSFWMIPRGLLGTWITANRHTTRPYLKCRRCIYKCSHKARIHTEIKCRTKHVLDVAGPSLQKMESGIFLGLFPFRPISQTLYKLQG